MTTPAKEAKRIEVRQADRRDFAALVKFQLHLGVESCQRELDEATIEAGISRVLENTAGLGYVVAVIDGRVVGQLAVAAEEVNAWHDGTFLWVDDINVNPDHRRLGVLRALIKAALSAGKASTDDFRGLRLHHHHTNYIAADAYRRLGFQPLGIALQLDQPRHDPEDVSTTGSFVTSA